MNSFNNYQSNYYYNEYSNSNTDDNEPVFENVYTHRERDPMSIYDHSIYSRDISELSALAAATDPVDDNNDFTHYTVSTCSITDDESNDSLIYSESDTSAYEGADVLNTANIDIKLDFSADTNTNTSHTQNYYFDKISTLTDNYIKLDCKMNSMNNRVELLQVSANYTDQHVNYLYQTISDSKNTIDSLNHSLNAKNEEISALREEILAMKRRMENMELRLENTVAHLRNTVDIHKIDTQNRINSLLIHRPKSL